MGSDNHGEGDILDRAPLRRSWLQTKMYQFELTFGTYMLEPWERYLVHTLYLVLLVGMLYATYDFIYRFIL